MPILIYLYSLVPRDSRTINKLYKNYFFVFVPFKIFFSLFLTPQSMPTSSTAISAFKILKLQHGKVTSILVLDMGTTDKTTHTPTGNCTASCFSVTTKFQMLVEGSSLSKTLARGSWCTFILCPQEFTGSACRFQLQFAFPKQGCPDSWIPPSSLSSWHPVLFFFIFPYDQCQVVRAGRSSTEADNGGFAHTGEPSILSGS